MKLSNSKTIATAISLFLMLTMAVSLVAVQTTNAQIPDGMTWDFPEANNYAPSATRLLLWERYGDRIPTSVYAVLSPNPVGVGQDTSIVVFNPQVPPGAQYDNDVQYQYTVTLTDPDGDTETIPATGTLHSDSTGSTFAHFTPDKVGDWTIMVKFHELFYHWWYEPQGNSAANSNNATLRNYYGVTFLESTRTYTLTVQDEPVEREFKTVPLPTEYWTRPIEGQNTQWYQVASNWLSGAHDKNNGGSGNQLQQDGTGPTSGHILWTKPTEDGGLIGGGNFSVPGEVFNAGHQYQTRFTNPIIMWGRLYYEVPIVFAGTGGGWMCVDLKTGEDLWGGPKDFGNIEIHYGPYTFYSSVSPSFGYYYDMDTRNDHGVTTPGWLFTNNFAQSIHPRYGILGQLNLTNVPSGYDIYGPKGEDLRYVFSNAGSRTDPEYRLLQWNSSRVFMSGTGEVDAGTPNAYDWNVSASWMNDMSSVSVEGVQFNDVLFGINGSHPRGTSAPTATYPTPVTIWAVNLNPASTQYAVGQLMYMKNVDTITDPPDGGEFMLERVGDGVAIFVKLPERYWVAYDIHTGNKMWDTSDIPESDFNAFGYYSFPSLIHTESTAIAYGKLFTGGYTGAVMCYDLSNGTLLWTYEAPTNQPIFEYYTLMLGPIVDGKIYVGTHEHSADTPLFKGAKTRCLNITNGEPIWEMTGWAHPYTLAVADGVLIYWNNYDHQVYAVGKGPSSTEVTASPKVSVNGNSVLVEGNVIDISAGTNQQEQAARFPNGVPAVSDDSMSAWMSYVYMQKQLPTNATGVKVTISVLDPNNNCYDVGTTTSDANGFYKMTFTPEVPGEYTIIATFAGSESYWPSHAVTAIGVTEAPAATPEPTPIPVSIADAYFVPGIIGIVIAIAVVGVVLVLMLRKR